MNLYSGPGWEGPGEIFPKVGRARASTGQQGLPSRRASVHRAETKRSRAAV